MVGARKRRDGGGGLRLRLRKRAGYHISPFSSPSALSPQHHHGHGQPPIRRTPFSSLSASKEETPCFHPSPTLSSPWRPLRLPCSHLCTNSNNNKAVPSSSPPSAVRRSSLPPCARSDATPATITARAFLAPAARPHPPPSSPLLRLRPSAALNAPPPTYPTPTPPLAQAPSPLRQPSFA